MTQRTGTARRAEHRGRVSESAEVYAAIYLRISSDRNGDELGVDRQEKLCRKLCAERGWKVYAVYKDNDKSAYDLNVIRLDYERMMRDIKAGHVNAIVAYNGDRIHRRLSRLCELIEILNKHDVQVATVIGGHVDLATAAGRFTAQMFGLLAEMESAIKSERLCDKMDELAEAGSFQGGQRPFGFEADGVTHRDDEADVIRQWADDVLAGKPVRQIAKESAAKGVLTPAGRAWRFSSIPRVLKSPRIAGLRQHRGEVIGEASWKPILDIDTWNAVRLVLEDPSRRHKRRGEYLLTGLLFTSDGDKLRGSRGHNGERIYRAAGIRVQADPIEQVLIEMALQATDTGKVKPPKPAKRNEAARVEVERIEAEIGMLRKAHDKGEITTADLIHALKPLNRAMFAAEQELAVDEASRRSRPVLTWMEKPGALRKQWGADDFTLAQKQEALAALIEHVIVLPARGQVFSNKRLHVAWRR